MSTMQSDLTQTIDRLCAEYCPRVVRQQAEEGIWPAALWGALDDLGIVRAALPEEAGGAGLAFDEVMLILRRTAFHSLPVPLAETMLAGRLLTAAGLPVPQGPITVLPIGTGSQLDVEVVGGRAVLSGRANRVPWGADCPYAVVAGQPAGQGAAVVGLVATAGAAIGAHRNLAGEPRINLHFDQAPLVSVARLDRSAELMELLGALYRSVQMTGALEMILSQSIQYANDRVQFGRPIAKFQAVQHMLSVLAGHVAASCAVVDAAVDAAGDWPEPIAVAIAKARISEAAGFATEIAHQVHGAMGFTHEHSLHYSTRRLWSWRDEFGGESHWRMRLGHEVCRLGPYELWSTLTRLQDEVLA